MINSANQGVMNVSLPHSTPAGDTWRSNLANTFNVANIERENWIRAEQAQDNQLARDVYMQQQANEFNAKEAQKARDWNEYMSNTEVSRRMADLKNAGLNPVLAVAQGASFAGGTSAQSSTPRSGTANTGASAGDEMLGKLLSTALQVGAGLITKFAGAGKIGKIGFGD